VRHDGGSYRFPGPRAPTNLDEALRTASEGVAGISAAQFRALLSPEDIADIEAGDVHPKTLHAYAESFAEGFRSGRIAVLAVADGRVKEDVDVLMNESSPRTAGRLA
jgi:hypothetical protein